MKDHFRHWLVRGVRVLSIVTLAVAGAAHAQAMARASQRFDIPAQATSAALNEFSKQSGLRLLFSYDAVEGMQADAISGTYSPEEVLKRLLAGTGLHYEVTADSVVLIRGTDSLSDKVSLSGNGRDASLVRPDGLRLAQVDGNGETAGTGSGVAESSSSQGEWRSENAKERPAGGSQDEEDSERGGIPEILVTGSKLGTLNADIRRSPDDIQPYVVLDREAIERSGAISLDDFLKNSLAMATNSVLGSQIAGPGGSISSVIDLRGLGADETLILVDGRRISAVNFGMTELQPDINGIPLSAIERIEVLPATASGIYGGGATGGVINIVMRRDYAGLNTKLTYGNTFGSDAATRTVDVSAGLSLNDGKTNLLFSSSYSDANPLLNDERDFEQRARQHILANNPTGFYSSRIPPLGETPNIRSTTGAPLTFKANNVSIGSAFTFIPLGYAGVSSDGGAALASNAGQYNLNLANTAQRTGRRSGLLNSPTVRSASTTLRHQISSHVETFVELNASRNSSRFATNNVPGFLIISSTASNNPFQQNIRVAVPLASADDQTSMQSDSIKALAGLIFTLPNDWQAEIDYSWNRSRFEFSLPGGLAPSALADVGSGAIDVLRDLNSYPLNLPRADSPFEAMSPADALLKNATLRLAGPLPFELPAGEVVVSALMEHRQDVFSEAINTTLGSDSVLPSRSQSVNSVYLEAKVPLVSKLNQVSGIQSFELQLAVRRDEYKVEGTTDDPQPFTRFANRNSSVDPTVGFRYQPVSDLTLRASYGTGYLPPTVFQLVPATPASLDASAFLSDPLRGNEPVGMVTILQGGSPDLRPEQSESLSAGLILLPRWLTDARLSVDWIKTKKRDNISGINAFTQEGLEDLIRFAPERINREPSSDEFGIGPITEIDGRALNIAELDVEAVDLAVKYQIDTKWAGLFDVSVGASRLINLRTRLVPDAPLIDYSGVSGARALSEQTSGLKWKANGSLAWQYGSWTIDWLTRFFDSYFLRIDHAVITDQGSATVPSQMYHDVSVRYRFGSGAASQFSVLSNSEIQFGVKNVFNKKPPVDVGTSSYPSYSLWGDPRLASYFVSIRKDFGVDRAD